MEIRYDLIALSVGGVIGVNARYGLAVAIGRWLGTHFPWATLLINVTGSFAIGLISVILTRWFPHHSARLFLVVGMLGGYTTFSSFSYEAMVLWERGSVGSCLAYMVSSLVAGFAAVLLGTAIGRFVAPAGTLTRSPQTAPARSDVDERLRNEMSGGSR